ncbi:MAG: monovalent cation/H+ antiporter subunit A [Gammaproteobacteria bacterium]|nr:MAG: monovalent cation/H+ antiporter subunit A [Gammaproteobacteria bacterium]
MSLALIVLLPFLGTALPLLASRQRSLCAVATALTPMLALGVLLYLSPAVFKGETLLAQWPWIKALGMSLAFRLDGLALLFAGLILSIGLLVILYARYYLSAQDNMGRFYSLLLLFMGSMLGVVTADNLILLLLFWELTSLSSFLLIGFWSHRQDARQGARMALTVTGGGGLALLAGILLIGHIVGSFELGIVLESGDILRAHPLYPLVLVLVLLGAFTKSAQFPFHFWLPHAMAAPTPVSAYLHSATMVKAGVFLLARFHPALAGTELWIVLVCLTGLATLLVGAYLALFQHDLKGLLAYSTISHLGLITLLFGLDTRLAAVAAVFHIINHAIFKASLFMAAGIIDHETGTRDMRRINGLWHYLPHTATLAMVASAAMAGVPLLNGFLSKEMFFSETLDQYAFGPFSWLVPVGATIAGVFAVAYSLRFVHDVFFNGEPIDLPKYPPHEPPRYMKIPVEILVALCLLVGIVPAMTIAPLLAVAATAVLGGRLPEYDIAIWHGFNLPFVMSLLAMAGGTLVYVFRRPLFTWHDRLPEHDAREVFGRAVQSCVNAASWLTHHLENGSLQRYMALLVTSALVVSCVAVWPLTTWQGAIPTTPADAVTVAASVMLAIAAIATVAWYRQRLLALMGLSIVGLLVSLAFARFSAPDLALTQIAVEVVTIVLLMLALFFMPLSTPAETGLPRRLRDSLLAVVAGSGMALITWAVLTRPYDTTLAGFFLAQSQPGGGGNNVVNVILVDFRGFDTFGEITVLVIAAIAVYSLIHRLQLPQPMTDATGRPWASERHPLILQMISRPLLPLALMVSIYIFLRGHNLPGGGFIAGLVTAVALILQYIASGVHWTRARLTLNYYGLAASGLLIAIITGLASLSFGYPFLTSSHGYLNLPLIGSVHLATALAFDLGVYFVVVATTLIILANLGKMTVPEYREETL